MLKQRQNKLKLRKKEVIERHIGEYLEAEELLNLSKNQVSICVAKMACHAVRVWGSSKTDNYGFPEAKYVKIILNDYDYIVFECKFIDTGGWKNNVNNIVYVQGGVITDSANYNDDKLDEFFNKCIIINPTNIEL